MAIDTAAKRKSVVGVGLHWLRMGVIADGSDLSAAQRLHTQAFYSGIAAAGVAAAAIAPGGYARSVGGDIDPWVWQPTPLVLVSAGRRTAGGLGPRRKHDIIYKKRGL